MKGDEPLVTGGCGRISKSKVTRSKHENKKTVGFQPVVKRSREPVVDHARKSRLLQVREQEKVRAPTSARCVCVCVCV
jgi:hypothetical protein